MTQDDLAAAAGMPVVSLRRYLNAQRHIDVAVLGAICEAMALDPQWVVAQAEERRAKARVDVVFEDPAAGSGGFLVEAHNRFMKQPDMADPAAVEAWLDDEEYPAGADSEVKPAARNPGRRGSTADDE